MCRPQVLLIIYQRNVTEVSVTIAKSELDYTTIKNNQLVLQCLECKNNYKKDYKGLINRFANTYEFCNGDNNIFILSLRIAVHSYECIDNWEIFNGTSLPDKKAFYS